MQQTETVDFTHCPRISQKMYDGANGSKRAIIYDNELYMLKFPSPAKPITNMSYLNGTVSEHIGCRIFESIGIPAQKTILGTYTTGYKTKIVVACKDFTQDMCVLQTFASLKNTIIDSGHNGTGTELDEILETINQQDIFDAKQLQERFWDMFVVDALIGNWDRHNGNWGFLYNQSTHYISFAPIYDCGSSLYPSADEKLMRNIMYNNAEDELLFRIYEIPVSALKINGAKIKYYAFISSLKNEGCNKALQRIAPKIDLNKINGIINETPFISDLHKAFLCKMIAARKELIIDHSYNHLMQSVAKEQDNDIACTTGDTLLAQIVAGTQKYAATLNFNNSLLKACKSVIAKDDTAFVKRKMIGDKLFSLGFSGKTALRQYVAGELSKNNKINHKLVAQKEHDDRSR